MPFGCLPEMTEKNYENLRKDNRSAGLNSNREPPKVNKPINTPCGKAEIMLYIDISAGRWRDKTKLSTSHRHHYTTFNHDV
jgi:hypothetical protein